MPPVVRYPCGPQHREKPTLVILRTLSTNSLFNFRHLAAGQDQTIESLETESTSPFRQPNSVTHYHNQCLTWRRSRIYYAKVCGRLDWRTLEAGHPLCPRHQAFRQCITSDFVSSERGAGI